MIKGVLAGLALAVVAAVTLVMVVVMLAGPDPVDITDLEVADCFDLAIDDAEVAEAFSTLDLVNTFDCVEPHTAQVVAVGDLNPDRDLDYPDDAQLFDDVDRRCSAVPADARFGIVPIIPTETTWNARSGRFVCVALTFGLIPVTGNHAAIAG